MEEVNANVSNASIAVDPSSDPKDTQMLEVLKAQVSQLEREAKSIFRREQVARVENNDDVLEPVEDAGGRQRLREVALGVQDAASRLGRRGRLELGKACASAEDMRVLDPVSLAMPTGSKPLSAWDIDTVATEISM